MLFFGKMPGKKRKMVKSDWARPRGILHQIDPSKRNFRIVLHNMREGHGPIPNDISNRLLIVRGIEAAGGLCDFLNRKVTQVQRDEGWSYYPEPTAERQWPRPKRYVSNPSGKSQGNRKR
jgi:hypothetical protein